MSVTGSMRATPELDRFLHGVVHALAAGDPLRERDRERRLALPPARAPAMRADTAVFRGMQDRPRRTPAPSPLNSVSAAPAFMRSTCTTWCACARRQHHVGIRRQRAGVIDAGPGS